MTTAGHPSHGEDTIRSALRRHLPALAEAPVRRLRPAGSAFSVGPDVVARVGGVRALASVLGIAAGRSTVSVPEPLFVDDAADVLAYRRIRGVALPSVEVTSHAQALTLFLGRVHGTYVGTVDRVLPVPRAEDVDPATALAVARDRRQRMHADLSVAVRALLDRALSTAPPAASGARALCHLDLCPEHLLMDRATGEITGVVGWGSAGVADPARELGGVLAHLGPAMYDAAVAGYRGGFDRDDDARALVFARCLLVQRIEQGLARGDRPRAKDALRRLQHLPA